ncbi:uncharacterized protein LOC62_06G007826 [Vanrija pseudolonga]|uniref:Uncharacterized protein n=1 Tax=Vanrija pseudolonga TaxID=143232 RepID=A0AAF0YIQ0_9TREE|nr:hypothetical protein LOC62_06G007826 [Vanrija pseudolonga]
MPRHRVDRVLVATLSVGALATLAAPVPSSTSTDALPSATPTPWRYPDTEENGVCRHRTKPECVRNAVALTLGSVFGIPVRELCARVYSTDQPQVLILLFLLVMFLVEFRGRIAAGFLAAPWQTAAWVGRLADSALGGIERAMRAATRRIPSRRPPPVPPKDGDAVELLAKKGAGAKRSGKKKDEVEDDDAESFITAAPSYHSGESAPTYTSSLFPGLYAQSIEQLSPIDEQVETLEASLPPGARPPPPVPPVHFAPLPERPVP